ncbi:hypothetical protein HMI54_002447 [Coelomomyces lativittatus]|nr:hypothetical protein HMI54_002447 [Coelomomyces lativittatus]
MQSMIAPILYVLFFPKPVERTSRLTYNIYSVPQIDFEKVKPRKSNYVWLLEVVPFLWGLFYVLIFMGFATGLTFGCGPYFNESIAAISESAWDKATRYYG